MIKGNGKVSEARFGLKAAADQVSSLDNPGKLSISYGFTVTLRDLKQGDVVFQFEQFRRYLKKFSDDQDVTFNMEIDEAEGLRHRIMAGIQEKFAAKQKQEQPADQVPKAGRLVASVPREEIEKCIERKKSTETESGKFEKVEESPQAVTTSEDYSSTPPADPQDGQSSKEENSEGAAR